MSFLNVNFSQNISIVRPEYFFITALSDLPYSSYYYIFLFIVYFKTVLGNSIVLLIIALNRRLHSSKYIAVFNLALADIGGTTAVIPNIMKTFFSDTKYISFNACLANMFFVNLFITVQSFILVVMAYDRFVAICFPLRYHALVNNTVMTLVFIVLWAFNAFVVGLPVSFVTQLSFCKSNVIQSYYCDYGPVFMLACNVNSINTLIRSLIAVLFLVAPLFIIVLSYMGIFFALSKITTWESRLKALKTCVLHLWLVGSFFLPVMCIFIASSITSLTPNAKVVSATLSFALPPMLNPIIYVLNTAEIRVLIRKELNNRSAAIRKRISK